MGVDGVDAGDGVQVAAPLVQDQPDLQEGLEPGAEAAAGATRTLGDRAQPPVIGRVQVEDPIGLAVADRAQHDRLGLQGPGRPAPLRYTL